MFIKNYKKLAEDWKKKDTLEIIDAGIEGVQPEKLVSESISYNQAMNAITIGGEIYSQINGRIFVVGTGKASGGMAVAIEKAIGANNIEAGIINTMKGGYAIDKIKIIAAGSPLPDRAGQRGAEMMLALKEKYGINEHDLVICLVSGGGSALLPYPVPGVSLKDKQKTTELLIRSGAPIHDINSVRKHLSMVKGGQLGLHFYPAKVVTLIISDVINNDMETIASGPTVPDLTTFNDAHYVLHHYNILDKVPSSVREYIERGCDNKAPETPKRLDNCDNYIIGSNETILEIMAAKARDLGYSPLIVTSQQTGDPVEAAKKFAQEFYYGKYSQYDFLLIGGETTPKVPESSGKGGRNQHFITASLASLEYVKRDWLVASLATDGFDFVEGVCGAMADKNDLEEAKKKKLDFSSALLRYNSYGLLKKLDKALLYSGPTGTNVGDVILYNLK